MFAKLLLAFILIPIAELYVLVKVGGYLGALNTVVLVVLMGFAGAYLARLQGVHTLDRIRTSLQNGKVPSGELLDGLLILIAGIMLLFPGFITDLAGIMLLLPPIRQMVKAQLMKRLKLWVGTHQVHINYNP